MVRSKGVVSRCWPHVFCRGLAGRREQFAALGGWGPGWGCGGLGGWVASVYLGRVSGGGEGIQWDSRLLLHATGACERMR